MKPLENLIGAKFNRLTIISINEVRRSSKKVVKVRCDCGTIKEIFLHSVTSGRTRSCGCYNLECIRKPKKHGLRKHPLYSVWADMKARCNNKNDPEYDNYGGRGIGISKLWLTNFLSFYKWAIKHGWERGLQIDRINNNKGYSNRNCRITIGKINCRNKRNNVLISYNGEQKTIEEWAEVLNISQTLIWYRLRKLKWPPEKAFFYPRRGIKN